MKTVEQVFELCEKTGSWYGIKIENFNQRNVLGDTVLHTVCSWGNLEPVKLLVAAGADVNAKGDHESTPLFNAITGKNPDVVSFLIGVGADPKIVNGLDWQLLDYARNVSAPKAILQILEKHSKMKANKGRGR